MATLPGVHDKPRLAPVVAIDAGDHRERLIARRDDLVNRHATLVPRLARRVLRRAPSSVTLDDLIAVGNLALLQAATRYRPSAFGDAPFEAYARHVVHGAMLNSFSGRRWRDVTVLSIDRFATENALNAATETQRGALAFDPPLFVDPVESIDSGILARRVKAAITLLPARQRAIMQACYAEDEPSIAAAGRRLGMGPRRAQQLHREALDTLRSVLAAAV